MTDAINRIDFIVVNGVVVVVVMGGWVAFDTTPQSALISF